MKKVASYVITGVLALAGGVFGAAFTRTLVPIATYLECHLHRCEDTWLVNRVLRGDAKTEDVRWSSIWNTRRGLPFYNLNETNPKSSNPNVIDLTFNPLQLDQDYDVATAKYEKSTCVYKGRVKEVEIGLKYAWGDYICDTSPGDGWTWSATIVTHPDSPQ
jgi:hypothetical protein